MEDNQFPTSAEEAQQHIRRIRSEKGLGDGPNQIGNNASDLESALRILSDDLYKTATHFLLEIIQNADDNAYTRTHEPSVSITYSPNRVRIDCNEDGFSFKNVDAICRICMSTKSGKSKSLGFVGEKGIGFKAVFKAASAVWIKSGHYSFKFDRDSHLGMIAPIWHKFPDRTRKGWTSILLDLDKKCNQTAIVDELKSYDARILLFLRRLRKLTIKVETGSLLRTGGFTRTLGRGEWPSENPAMMMLRTDRKQSDYFVWKQTVNDMPAEERRRGISSSEIILAFPLDRDRNEPLLQEQNVYAFLPIRDCGFKFLLQADFLLPANREDVIADSSWNQHLANAAASAYADAMLHMANKKSKLRYTIVRFIPSQDSHSPLLEVFRQSALASLKNAAILETQGGILRPPTSTTAVPKQFCDNKGQPFLLNFDTGLKYLSEGYSEGDRQQIIAHLGVQVMVHDKFVGQAKTLLEKSPERFFTNRDEEWQASFFQLVSTMPPADRNSLAVIRLRSGEWVKPDVKPIFFPKGDEADSAIPEGISARVVDSEAANDPSRRSLYTLMGVKEYHDSDIVDLILKLYRDGPFNSLQLSTETIVSHSLFLYKAKWENSNNVDFLMASHEGSPRLASSMYIPSTLPSSASKVLPEGCSHAFVHGFLDPEYFCGGREQDEDWVRFLQDQLLIPIYPRLFNPGKLKLGSSVHPHFLHLMNGILNAKCLIILRDGWDYYKRFLDQSCANLIGLAPPLTRQLLLDSLRDASAECIGHKGLVAIKNSFSPLPELIEAGKGLAPLLSIPEPQDPRWEHLLKCLNVGAQANLKFYLQCLRKVSKSPKIDLDTIREFMREVQLKSASDLTLLRHAFETEKLIYVPSFTSSWITAKDCIWRGENWLKRSASLQRVYPDNEILFRNYLLIPNSEVQHIIKEAEDLKRGNKISHISRVLLALADHIRYETVPADQRVKLQGIPMLPIATKDETKPYSYLSAARGEHDWLIADRAVFWINFRHALSLVALPVDTILKIQDFLKLLHLEGRFLSKVATSVLEAHGDEEASDELTERYQSRADYILRLIPKHLRQKDSGVQNFRSVQVYLATEIVQYWRAPLGLTQIQSTLSKGVAFIQSDAWGRLEIYLRRGYESEDHMCELAEQLRQFFHVPPEDRDLLNLVLTGRAERINQLFEERGIPPLSEDVAKGEDDEQSGTDFDPGQEKRKAVSRPAEDSASRFARLLHHLRFSSSAAAQNGTFISHEEGVSQPPVIQTIAVPEMRSTLMQMEFWQSQGTIQGTRGTTSEVSFLEKFKGLGRSDSDVGEMIVSDILEEVLGDPIQPGLVWQNRDSRAPNRASFAFTDYQGRFTAVLARLSGLTGRTQGHGNIIYHIDVKTASTWSPAKFRLSKEELSRAQEYSILRPPLADVPDSPFRNVYVIAFISGVRKNPSIAFLTDPWELVNDGQLQLDVRLGYRLSLQLKPRTQQPPSKSAELTGLEAIQFKPVGALLLEFEKKPEPLMGYL